MSALFRQVGNAPPWSEPSTMSRARDTTSSTFSVSVIVGEGFSILRSVSQEQYVKV